jgi:hypothetical protein
MTRALLLLALLAPVSRACINDGFTADEEREFKGRYDQEQARPIKVELGMGSLGAVGALLVAGALWRAARGPAPAK